MSNRLNTIITEARKAIRVNINQNISWRVKDTEYSGQGKICNVSTSGMLLETDSSFKPTDQCVFAFDAASLTDNFIPPLGQLVWSKRKNLKDNQYLCGIKFLEPTEDIVTKLRQKVEDGMTQIKNRLNTEKVVGAVVGVVLVILTGYILWLGNLIYQHMQSTNQALLENANQQAVLTQTYATLYKVTELKLESVTAELETTKKLYADSQAQLETTSKELETTRSILKQTEAMLIEAQANNSQLKTEVQSVRDSSEKQIADIKDALEKTISVLESNNIQLTAEITTLRDKLNYLSGEIKSEEEGRSLLALYKNRAKLVRGKIKKFQHEAYEAKLAVIKEYDRVRASIGNNGYFTRNGDPVKVDMEKYSNVGKTAPAGNKESPAASKDHKVNVDVDFVN